MTAPMRQWILVNGKRIDSISSVDRGLFYGDGLFETIRANGRFAPLLNYHIERLVFGAERLSIPIHTAFLKAQIEAFLNASDAYLYSSSTLKILLTRGAGGQGYRPPTIPATEPTLILQQASYKRRADLEANGVELAVCPTPIYPNPILAGIKHLNRLDYVMAAKSLEKDSTAQPLLRDPAGRVLEALHHNIFVVNEGTLCTPQLKNAGVHGVMRRVVMQCLAVQAGLQVKECDLSLDDLLDADEIFLSNGVHGIWPVNSLENKCWKSDLPITQIILKSAKKILDGQGVYESNP